MTRPTDGQGNPRDIRLINKRIKAALKKAGVSGLGELGWRID